MEAITQERPVSHSSPPANANSIDSVLSPSPSTEDKGPVLLSFPSILRNPGLTSRYAHLVESRGPPSAPAQPKKLWRRNDNEGKRWVRRRENAGFTDNPHITLPTKRDLEPAPELPHATFPIPLPPFLPRSAPLPAAVPPAPDAKASTAGQFAFSVRGVRRALRGRHGAGPRTQALVRGVEDELVRWLRGEDDVVVVRDPDDAQRLRLSSLDGQFQFPGRAVAGMEEVREVERSPQRLVWWIENDTWARYVVHCCARYHNVVSFSKDTPTHRLTHILRPNATRPDTAARAALATPPTTDGDLSSQSPYESDMPSSLSDIQSIDGGSDILSESDFVSDLEPGREQHHHGGGSHRRLSHLGGEAAPLSDIAASDVDADVETGSVQGDDGGGIGGDLQQATAALSLVNEGEALRLPLHGAAYRTRTTVWDTRQGARSGSSPSRSPARRQPRRRFGRAASKKVGSGDAGRRESFYDFLFK